jgi:hypothetical protein
LPSAPAALVASVAWESDGEVTCVNVWDSPDAIADFFLAQSAPTFGRGADRRPVLRGVVRIVGIDKENRARVSP